MKILHAVCLMFFLSLTELGCHGYQKEIFYPLKPSPNNFHPLRVCGSLDLGSEAIALFGAPETGHVPIFADRPIAWTPGARTLVINYNGISCTLPAKDQNGWPPKLTPTALVYIGKDEHSVIVYEFASSHHHSYAVRRRTPTVYGISTLFSLGHENDDDDTWEVYLIDPMSGVRVVGAIPRAGNRHPIVFEDNNALFVTLGTKVYECTSSSVTEIIDLNAQVTLDSSIYDAISVEAVGGDKAKSLLIRYKHVYYIVSLEASAARITDDFSFEQYSAMPEFVYYDNQWVTCVDHSILRRNPDTHIFEKVVDLPQEVNTQSTHEPLTATSSNLIFHLFDSCDGNLTMVTDKGLVIYNQAQSSFTQYVFVKNSYEKLNFVADNDAYLVLGTDSGKYLMIPRHHG